MSRPDPALARIARFNQCHGGGVSAAYRQGGYTLTSAATGAPDRAAQAHRSGRPHMRVFYWSHREKWKNAGPPGGVVLPLDNALKTVASEPVFWIWT